MRQVRARLGSGWERWDGQAQIWHLVGGCTHEYCQKGCEQEGSGSPQIANICAHG